MTEIVKIPPQDLKIEEAVLGACLLDTTAILNIEFLHEEMFYNNENRLIFKAIRDLVRESRNVDLLTVGEQLSKNGTLERIGGNMRLVDLTMKIASSNHIEEHAGILVEKYVKRQAIKSANKLLENSYDHSSDINTVIGQAYKELNDVAEASIRRKEIPFQEAMDDVIQRGRKIYEGDIKAGVPTPIRKLTEVTGGWRDGELIIHAGRPGMGKTAFAILQALQSAKEGIPTAFFSLEMSTQQLVSRILSMENRIPAKKFNVHGLSEDDRKKIMERYTELSEIPLHIDDTSNLTIEQLQIKAKRLHAKHGVKLIIIDYLQLMTGSKNAKNREQEISRISRGCKLIAKELNIPVIALSQLSRSCEARGGMKRPLLSDLRESGAIEQDADIVMFHYRPEYYDIMVWDDGQGSSTEGQAEGFVAKNRNGSLTKVRMKFEGKYTLFSELEQDSNDGLPF